MGGGNRERREQQAAANANYTAALNTAQQESPYERRRREFNENILAFAESGDYRNPTGAMRVFFNFSDPAERKRRSDVLANTRGQGVSALGAGANPELLALDKQHRDAEFERDAAANYQSTLSRVVAGALDETGDLQRMDQARRLGVLGTTAGVHQSALGIPRRPSWWERLMGGAQQGAQTAGAAFAGGG